MPYTDPNIRRERQRESARLRRAATREDGTTRLPAVSPEAEVSPQAEEEVNPIVRFRESLNLGRQDLAIALGVGYAVLAKLELGHPDHLPDALYPGLVAMGADPRALDRDYRAWRQRRGQALLARLQRRPMARSQAPRVEE